MQVLLYFTSIEILSDLRLDYDAARGPHFSNLRSGKISMLVKYNKTCIDSSSFVIIVKVHFLVAHTARIFVHRSCQQ